MSTPGSGGPQPPDQDPTRWGQPSGWGQQPSAGQPHPGPQQPQQPWAAPGPQRGQPGYGQQGGQPGYGQPAFGQPAGGPGFGPPQPGGPGFGRPGGPQAHGRPGKPTRRWLPLLGGLVALIVLIPVLISFLGGGDPEVGDCVKPDGASFEKVDCEDSDAEAKIVGTDDDMTGTAFDAADPADLCTEIPSTTVVLWSGTDNEENGHVYCAEGL